MASTNTEALDWARDHAPDGAWVTAEEQTEGRGRAGRSWHSPRGNLHASVVIRNPGAAEDRAKLGFVCGLALHDALVRIAPELKDRARLKWPNDMLIDGRKMSGILLEAHQLADPAGRPTPVVIAGFGVNVVAGPSEAPYPTTDLLSLGIDVGADVLWETLSACLAQRLQMFRDEGFEPIRNAWIARAQGIGRPVSVAPPQRGVIEGVFAGIDRTGALLLETADGETVCVHTGDVLFPATKRSVA